MNDEIERLVASINDRPDLLHGDRTPAVDALIEHGLAALPHVLPLLESEDEFTRLRAQRVLEGATQAWVRGEQGPARQLTQGSAQAWQRLWRENGSYDWRAAKEARTAVVGLWREWLGRVAE